MNSISLVSIIMPNYNSERFLHETIKSVINQTYTNWELIIVDDCSTDSSLDIIKEYASQDSRIRLFENEKNMSAAYSRNLALREAKGKWIAFLDSDDIWYAQKLEKQIDFMVKNNYKFTYTKYEKMDEEGNLLNSYVSGPKKIGKVKMFMYCYIGCLTVMYDAEHIGLVQIDERVGNGRNDYALWLKAVRKEKCYYFNENLAIYRIRNKSLSKTKLKTLIKYQFQLYRYSEDMGVIRASIHTLINIVFGMFKKINYTRKVKTDKK